MAVRVETAALDGLVREGPQQSPQGYGYLAGYWAEGQELGNTDRNDARVSHLYEEVPEPRSPLVGSAGRSFFTELDALSIPTDRPGASRCRSRPGAVRAYLNP